MAGVSGGKEGFSNPWELGSKRNGPAANDESVDAHRCIVHQDRQPRTQFSLADNAAVIGTKALA